MNELWAVAIGGAIGAVSSWATVLISRYTGRSQWLTEQRFAAYSIFYDRWENCWKNYRDSASKQKRERSLTLLDQAARAVDLLGDADARNSAWSARGAIVEFGEGLLNESAVRYRLNTCLNSFKKDLGIPRQIWT